MARHCPAPEHGHAPWGSARARLLRLLAGLTSLRVAPLPGGEAGPPGAQPLRRLLKRADHIADRRLTPLPRPAPGTGPLNEEGQPKYEPKPASQPPPREIADSNARKVFLGGLDDLCSEAAVRAACGLFGEVSSQQPAASSQLSAASSQQSAVSSQQSAVSSQQPAASSQQPAGSI